MEVEKIFDALKNLDGIIACGVIDEKGNIYECYIPEDFPKDKLSVVYSVELNASRIKTLFWRV